MLQWPRSCGASPFDFLLSPPKSFSTTSRLWRSLRTKTPTTGTSNVATLTSSTHFATCLSWRCWSTDLSPSNQAKLPLPPCTWLRPPRQRPVDKAAGASHGSLRAQPGAPRPCPAPMTRQGEEQQAPSGFRQVLQGTIFVIAFVLADQYCGALEERKYHCAAHNVLCTNNIDATGSACYRCPTMPLTCPPPKAPSSHL